MHAQFRITLRPLAGSETEGAWYRGWRVMALDGSCLDVADTVANEIAFGGQKAVARLASGDALPC